MPLFDDGPIEPFADQLIARFNGQSRIVIVEGAAGAGRSSLARAIESRVPASVWVQAPPLGDPDAVLHTLLQAAAPTSDLLRSSLHHEFPLIERARLVGNALAEQSRFLLLRLPVSWEEVGVAEGPDREIFRSRARQLLVGLRDASGLSIVIFVTRAERTLLRKLAASTVLRLPQPKCRADALRDLEAWGPLQPAAETVSRILDNRIQQTGPLQLRLMIGLAWLNGTRVELQTSLGRLHAAGQLTLDRLLDFVIERLSTERSALLAAANNLAQARFAMPISLAQQISSVSEEEFKFLSECIGYTSNGTVKLAETVRNAIRRKAASPQNDTSIVISEHYAQQDGVSDPTQLQPTAVVPWLEKVHHLACADVYAQARWELNDFPTPEFYWDRARALSIIWKRHENAAAVYARCASHFPSDDYSWHYMAWNLAKSDGSSQRIEDGYRRALDISGANPWWNSRLITFLIENSRFIEAEKEFMAAWDRLDPDRSLISEEPRLALSFHRWIMKAWLDQAETLRARRVFDSIPVAIVQGFPELQELEWRLLDSEESLELGESVYPAGIAIEQRWKRPSWLAETSAFGRRLRSWHPGRIVSADPDSVHLVLAIPDSDQDERRVIRTWLTAREWQDAGGWARPQDARGYVILARYDDDTSTVHPMNAPIAPWESFWRSRSDT